MVQAFEAFVTAWKLPIVAILSALMVANQQYPIIPSVYIGLVGFVLAFFSGLTFSNQHNQGKSQ